MLVYFFKFTDIANSFKSTSVTWSKKDFCHILKRQVIKMKRSSTENSNRRRPINDDGLIPISEVSREKCEYLMEILMY